MNFDRVVDEHLDSIKIIFNVLFLERMDGDIEDMDTTPSPIEDNRDVITEHRAVITEHDDVITEHHDVITEHHEVITIKEEMVEECELVQPVHVEDPGFEEIEEVYDEEEVQFTETEKQV